MGVFRSDQMIERYRQYKETDEFNGPCVLCAKPALKTFVHWKIIENQFPYDQIASEHTMLIPLRHVTEPELTEEERAEFMQIKYSEELQQHYDNFIESTHQARSIPWHFHLHLIKMP